MNKVTFTGLIKPGQDADHDSFKVMTCFHGIEELDRSAGFYFTPHGTDHNYNVLSVSHLNNRGRMTGFQVIADLPRNFLETVGEDYIEVKISRSTTVDRGGNNVLQLLADTLRSRGLLQNNIVKSLGGGGDDTNYFALGYPNLEHLSTFNNGLLLSCNMISDGGGYSNQPYIPRDRRTNILMARYLATNIPTFQGMSGGPVVTCDIRNLAISCRILGVVHGSDFVLNGNRGPREFKSLAAIIP